MNEEKNADNNLYNSKKKMEVIEGQLYTKEKSLRQIDQLESSLLGIKLSMNKCIELCNRSIKQKKFNDNLNYANEENNSKFLNIVSIFDDDREQIKDEIINLYNEKEETMKEIKEELNKEDEKDSNNKEIVK